MHNPKATSTAKIPLSMPSLSWAAKNDSVAMAAFASANVPATSGSRSGPTIIKSGSSGYDGTTDPGKPGEPV